MFGPTWCMAFIPVFIVEKFLFFNLCVPSLFILPILVCFFSPIFFLFFALFFIWIPLQNTSVASPTSRMPVPMSAKARQSPGATDKAGKQHKLQDAQRQFRQVVLM